ncbi:MAG: chain length determinant protein EpsF [Gammaproteobacteria bacterium]|nr:chain length determinant protein EpsF [Gammaproteobacteria bacterium]
MSFQQLILLLRYRWKAVAGIPLLFAITAVVLTLTLPKQYSASTSLLMDFKSADALGSQVNSQLVPSLMATQIDVIRSDRVALQVVEKLNLASVADLREQWQAATNGQGTLNQWLAALIKKNLQVLPSRDSNLITIEYTSVDPQFSAQVANTFADAYQDVAVAMRVEPARRYAEWFQKQSTDLRERLNVAQRRLSEYQQQHGILIGTGLLDVETARLAELSRQYAQAQGQSAESSSRASEILSIDSLPEVLQNPLVAGFKADLTRLESNRQKLLGQLGANHPEVARVEAEIGVLRSRLNTEVDKIAKSLGTSTRISAQRETDLQAVLDEQKAKVLALRQHVDQIALLQRDVDSANRAYDLVSQRLSLFDLESETQMTNVAVLNPAVPPLRHSSPRGKLNVIIALVLGAFFGVAVAVVMELLGPKVRSTADLELMPNLPVLAEIASATGRAKPATVRAAAAA